MDARDRQKITTSEQYMCDNIIADVITDHLVEDAILNTDDVQRIQYEISSSRRVKKMLRIIEEHPKGFKSLCDALRKEGMEFIAEALEATPVDEQALEREKQWSDKKIDDTLTKNFCYGKHQIVYLGSIVEEIKLEFRLSGDCYSINDAHVLRRVKACYPGCQQVWHKKRKEWEFQNLQRRCFVSDTGTKTTKDTCVRGEEVKKKTPPKENVGTSSDIKKPLTDLSPRELADLLCPHLNEYDIPKETLTQIIDGEINGKRFKRLDIKYMHGPFPNYSEGDKLSLLTLRDDLFKDENNEKGDESTVISEEIERSEINEGDLFLETFRKFDKEARAIDCYRKDAIIRTSATRPSNMLQPIHFVSSISIGYQNMNSRIADEVVEFAAACLNERNNGTIHFGIKQKKEYHLEGQIKGLPLDPDQCSKCIYETIEKRFYDDQITTVLKCIRPFQYIGVTAKERQCKQMSVLEIDIVPQSQLTTDEAFFIKSREKKSRPVLLFFKDNCYSLQQASDEKTRMYMSKTKNLISDCRRKHEERPILQNVKQDLRQKMLDCLCFGEEHMPSDEYPLVFLSPFPDTVDNFSNFEFLVHLDANAFFDFDCSPEKTSLYSYIENEKCQVIRPLTTDNFDTQSQENQRQKESHSNLLDEIRQSKHKPWIFCNGYEAMDKLPLSRKDWKQCRRKGFKEAIHFYSQEIPEGRAMIIFLLFSKQYDVMLEAAEEVILTFKEQWIVIAENEEIAHQWITELIRRETVDKKEIQRRCIFGMPWNHVNQTIQQLSNISVPIRCEIPTSSGAFCHLPDKKRSELHDLEVISRNECDDPEIINDCMKLADTRRTVEETFYKGGSVSWWNFWFPDHVLKRDVHKKLKTKIKEALEGNRADEDNRIGLVNIYHQPGAGGTTTAMHVLWELRDTYRCCIVKQLTDQTVEQITYLRTFEDTEDPRPPLVFIDNGDEEKVGDLFAVLSNIARIVARSSSSDMKVFCVLLLCIRRANITTKDESSVALRHDLSPKEHEWFRNRHRILEKQFLDKKGPDPKFLISFNILKENFSTSYIKRTAQEMVKGVDDPDERTLLKYLSLLNTFDLGCQPVHISAFDPIMTNKHKRSSFTFGLVVDCGRRMKTDWENGMSQPLQVLLNQNCRAGLGRQLMGLSIINQLFAKEIFSCFNKPPDFISTILIEFLESDMFKSSNMSSNELMKIVKNIMKKREEREYFAKDKFSPLIMRILETENEEKATDVLNKVYEMTRDAMICQHIARLYIYCQNWSRAVEYAQMAVKEKPFNPSLWDTFGQVYKNQLLTKYLAISQERADLTDDEIEEAIDIAREGISKFRREQQVSETEFFSKGTNAGYYGELRIIVLLLDLLRFCPLGRQKVLLHKYLTDKTFLPDQMSRLKSESVDFMKSLEEKTEMTIQTIEEKLTQLKDDLYYSIFGKPMLAKNAVATLRENLDSYFGEESDEIPTSLSESERVAYRRRRVKRLGGRFLFNYLRMEKEENLNLVLEMLLANVRSEYWEIFDVINLISIVIAMKIRKVPQDKIKYSQLVYYSRKCYEKAILCSERRPCLEVFMYFVLFNWPTESRKGQSLCSIDQLRDATKRWRNAFYENHPRQKDTKPIRKRETTIFFLGNGTDMDAIVHYEELHDPHGKKFIKGDRVWETDDFIRKLLRLQGTLIEGTEVSCNIETVSGGISPSPFIVPTSVHVVNRSLWQKRIYFVLGFSWAGIKAFDVRQEIPQVSMPIAFPIPDHNNTGQQAVTSRKSGVKFETHDQFMATFVKLRMELDDVRTEMIRKPVNKELQALQDKEKEIKSALEKLIKAREDFFSS